MSRQKTVFVVFSIEKDKDIWTDHPNEHVWAATTTRKLAEDIIDDIRAEYITPILFIEEIPLDGWSDK